MKKAYSYIRFSTPEQRKGDSLRRQTELSQRYASNHGLVLDDSLKLQDLGISAYSGKHRSDQGALGQFLDLIETGKIEEGSVLLVESLDRLSREKITTALEQFLAIIRRGIKIVTLLDNREYSQETINTDFGEIIISLTIMARAHEESATKAMRLGKAWEGKRKLSGIKKLTARCPAWLRLCDDKTKFTVIADRKEAICRIFDMKLSGKGANAIIHELNGTQGIWKPESSDKRKTAGGWRESYVKKILQNRAVIGEFQPHRLLKGKRHPIGEPILDYYPSIVEKDVFYRVQEQIRQNVHKGGQIGTISNLFSHIVKCGYCGGPLAFVNKGPAPKGGQYLVCDRARRGLGCSRVSVKYGELERLVLSYCKGLHPQDILDTRDETTLTLLKKEHDGIIGELNSNIAIRDCMGAKAGERVLVVTDEPLRTIGFALQRAARDLGLDVLLVDIIPRTSNGEEPPAEVADLMKRADIVLCPTSKSLTHTDSRRAASLAGARVATLPGVTEAIMVRCMNADYKAIAARTYRLCALLERTSVVRVSAPAGTEITMPIKGRQAHASSGLFLESGQSGNLPTGEAYLAPLEGKSSGVVVVDGSMAGVGMMSQPLRIVVENGYATEISGGPEAQALIALLAPHGRDGRTVAEFGIGTNDKAILTGVILEDEKVMGTIHIAFGDNKSMGGNVRVASHLDGLVRNPTVWFDDAKVMEDGRLLVG